MPIDRQPVLSALPHLEEPAPGEWLQAPDPSAPRTAAQAADIPFWTRLFRNPTPGIPGTKKPDERVTPARRQRNISIAKSANPRLMHRQVRAKPKTPTKPCQTPHRPPVNPEAATAAADHAVARIAEETTRTHPATTTATTAAKAGSADKATNPANPPKAANRAAVRCQNPPS